jgi:hypothetical protein
VTRLVVRVRPENTIDDLDISVVRERVDGLSGWDVEVEDTTLYDATYVTVVARPEKLDDDAIEALRSALANLPQMRPMVWRRSASDVPLAEADPETLRTIAESDDS